MPGKPPFPRSLGSIVRRTLLRSGEGRRQVSQTSLAAPAPALPPDQPWSDPGGWVLNRAVAEGKARVFNVRGVSTCHAQW